MKFLLLCLLAIAASAQNTECNSAGGPYGVAGQFDFYVFQQEWAAQFCSGQSYPLCSQPNDFMTTNLVIHGLWPNYNTEQNGHDWPQCCNSVYGYTLNQTAINMAADDMHQYWPDEKANPGYNTSSFWLHEWAKHGTCSGLDQYTYFESAIQVEKTATTPSAISSNAGGSASLASLYAGYNQPVCDQSGDCYVSIDCTSDGYLSHVTTCWDKNSLSQVKCPNEVIKSDNCPDPVNIASF